MNLKNKAKDITRPLYGPILKKIRSIKKKKYIYIDIERIKEEIQNSKNSPRVFYLGITAHSNLGDMAQYYCIKEWIKNNYSDHKLIQIESNTIVEPKLRIINYLKDKITREDIFIFQSGYTTQDLGGNHDLMHRIIINNFPDAKILMMPQTIFFRNTNNKKRSAEIYNTAKNMLFLARDNVSYTTAKEMMPDINVKLFPDIVTTLIGRYQFNHKREGIFLCTRNDGEKFYSIKQINELKNKLEKITIVKAGDTTIHVPYKDIRKNTQYFIDNRVEEFSKYKVVITDRYHGIIFALAAATPVIILQTTDHKVITGADWFNEELDEYVHVAKNLNEVIDIYLKIKDKKFKEIKNQIFKERYYNKLKNLFINL